jgi:hypothetical protein
MVFVKPKGAISIGKEGVFLWVCKLGEFGGRVFMRDSKPWAYRNKALRMAHPPPLRAQQCLISMPLLNISSQTSRLAAFLILVNEEQVWGQH